MIRLSLLTLFLSFVCLYAFKDWFKSLCGLIIIIGVLEHPDMPKSIGGIQGLNPWNIVLLFVLAGWYRAKEREGLSWDLPRHINVLLIIYLIVVVFSFLHMLRDQSGLASWYAYKKTVPPSTVSLISEYIINAFKWLIPAALLYHGCNSRERLVWATAALLGIYVLLAVQVIKWMPLSTITSGDELSERSLKVLMNEVGFHRVNLSMMLAGAAWGIFSARVFVKSKYVKWVILLSGIVFMGQALTGGRTGYVTWAVVGFVLATFKWRKYLVLAPIFVMLVFMAMPSTVDRLTQGFGEDSFEDDALLLESEYYEEPEGGISFYTVTSGRSIAWPYVLAKIEESPWLGYGRLAMVNVGLTEYLWTTMRESFPHPHNLYLEIILEAGLLGGLPIILLFLTFVKRSLSLFREKHCIACIGAGGVAFSLVGAFLFAGIGSQTFYPREGAVGMWCAIALMMRVYQQREYLIKTGQWRSEDGDELLWKKREPEPKRRFGKRRLA